MAVALGEDTNNRHAISLVSSFPWFVPAVSYEFSINEKHSFEALTIAASINGLKYNRAVGSYRFSVGFLVAPQNDLFDYSNFNTLITASIEHRITINEHWYTRFGGGSYFGEITGGMPVYPFLQAGIGYAI